MNSRSRRSIFGLVAGYLAVSAIVMSSAVLPAMAEVWGVKTHGPFSAPPSTLFRFAEDGGAFTVIGEIRLDGQPVEVDGLAIDAEGELFAFIAGDASGQLITIDPSTAAASMIGILGGREIRGAAFTAAGELIGIDIFESALVEIDPATGQQIGVSIALTLAGEPFDVGTGTDLAISQDGVAVLSSGVMEIYEVDLGSGVLTLLLADTEVGDDGIPLFGAGLAFPAQPVGNILFLYDVNGDDDIFSYELEDPFTRTLVFPDIIASYNAGRGDLASNPMVTVAAPEDHGSAPERPRLLPSFPNPFNPQTMIAFSVPRSQHVIVSVHGVDGKYVTTLADRDFAAGSHALPWNGLDARGKAMSSGTYLVRLRTDNGVEARKVSLVR